MLFMAGFEMKEELLWIERKRAPTNTCATFLSVDESFKFMTMKTATSIDSFSHAWAAKRKLATMTRSIDPEILQDIP